MTEQSKIPVPPKAKRPAKGESLLERASGAFALDSFAPAPVPADLAPAPAKRGRAKATKAAEQPVETPQAAGPAAPPADDAAPVWEPVAETPKPTTQAKPLVDLGDVGSPPQEVTRARGAKVSAPQSVQSVDRRKLAEQGFIVPDGAVTALLEEFRIVKRAVLDAARKSDMARRVLVCSPLPGEGKTFCATNLALAIAAEKDSEVLLVDADFAKPSVLSVLGLTAGQNGRGGLMDALADPSVPIEDCVIATDIAGLKVLPAGSSTTSDSEYLTSRRTAEVFDRLTEGAPDRIVIFDSPPALAASPAAELAKHVGQAVLVARADTTGRSAMEDALQLLGACRDIKLLLNDSHFSPSGRRFGAYYGYGG